MLAHPTRSRISFSQMVSGGLSRLVASLDFEVFSRLARAPSSNPGRQIVVSLISATISTTMSLYICQLRWTEPAILSKTKVRPVTGQMKLVNSPASLQKGCLLCCQGALSTLRNPRCRARMRRLLQHRPMKKSRTRMNPGLSALDRQDPLSRDSEAGRRARMGSSYAFVRQGCGFVRIRC
jgi:hypothetical protein